MSILRGLITRSQSGFYNVKTDQGTFVCRLRGRLKKGPRQGDMAAIGDWVRLTRLDGQKGVIEEVEERTRMLTRLAPTPSGQYQQIIIANPDQAVFVFACAQPEPRFGMLDRFLVIAEMQHIPALIVANKIDLVGVQPAEAMFGHYALLGYPLIYTSAKTGQGVEELKERLVGEISVLAGPSGAGKSSLLNTIQPNLGLLARKVSRATSKGRHTTVVREMFLLEGGGYVADTPGLKALALWDIEPEELAGYFPELRELVAECQFNDCTHLHEPGCAVQAALSRGEIHPERYNSYVRMRMGDEE
ncbi:MAG: ribosome small subunit-dependent GTPase A [Anaerolineales bacterium]|nr:ribosome small subunit-dependent GTPase A [Anaerolineales bacterium]